MQYIDKKDNTNYIYLLKPREFIRTNENIYKIGRTSQNGMKRIKQYPKGSELILFRKCINCVKIEGELIKLFKIQYKHMPIYGNEYFEGNEIYMIKDINNIIDNEIEIINNEIQTIDNEIQIINNKKYIIDDEIQIIDNEIQTIDDEIQIINNKKYIIDDEIQIIDNKIQTIDNEIQIIDDEIQIINNGKEISNKNITIIDKNITIIDKNKIIDLSQLEYNIIIDNYKDLVTVSGIELTIKIIDYKTKYGYYQIRENNNERRNNNEMENDSKYYFFGDDININIKKNQTLLEVLLNNYSYNDTAYINLFDKKYISCEEFNSIKDINKYNYYKLIIFKIDYDKIIEDIMKEY
jgi:hypothetical protein